MLPRRLFHCYICHFIYIKVLLRSKPFYFNLLYRSSVTGNHGPLIVILLKQYHFLYRLKCNTNQFSDTKPCIFFLFFCIYRHNIYVCISILWLLYFLSVFCSFTAHKLFQLTPFHIRFNSILYDTIR